MRLKDINEALFIKYPYQVILEKANNYFYIRSDYYDFSDSMICNSRLKDYSFEEWMRHIDILVKSSENF